MERRRALEREHKELYAQVFQGPTPEFPEEDAAEAAVAAAVAGHTTAEQARATAQRAVEQLTHAQQHMQRALSEVQSALTASMYDIAGTGNNFYADMQEHSALGRAEAEAQRMYGYVMAAVAICPDLSAFHMPPVHVQQGDILGDVMFDNVYTDMHYHQQHQRSQAQLQAAAAVLAQMHAHAVGAQATAAAASESTRAAVQHSRSTLTAIRDRIFASVTAAA